MRLILIGPPGSGKGTQAKLLCQRLDLVHIATGDIIRDAIRRGTPAGRKAEPYVKAGQLAPDELVNDLVADRFRGPDRPARFIFDGYPRTRIQAAALDQVLEQQRLPLDAVIYLDVGDEEIVRRVTGRWICPNDQTPYHIESKPPRVAGQCDLCGAGLIQRGDDREETVRERLRVYRDCTAELIPYYRQRGLLREVAGQGDVDGIYAAIVAVLPQEK